MKKNNVFPRTRPDGEKSEREKLSFFSSFAWHHDIELMLPVTPEWIYYRSSETRARSARIKQILRTDGLMEDLAIFLSTDGGYSDVNYALASIDSRVRLNYDSESTEKDRRGEKGDSGEAKLLEDGYSPHNLARFQNKGMPHNFKGFLKIIDQCISDDPEHQTDDPSLVRVFTKESAKKFIVNVGDDIERLGRAWNSIIGMSSNNGYRRIIDPSETLFDRLEKLKLDFPNFQEVTIDVIRQIKTWRLMKREKQLIAPILLNGKKGCGKTAYSQALADALGTSSAYLNLAATSCYAVLTGLSQKWSNGQPGMIFQELASGESASPVVLLDEIDKISGERHMPVDSALFSLIDPQIASRLTDEFGNFQFNAGRVIYLATSNDLKNIQPPIVSRFKVFEIRPPTESQKLTIIERMTNSTYNNIAFSEGAKRLLVGQGDDLRDLVRLINQAVGMHAEGLFNAGHYTSNEKGQPQIVSELSVRAAMGGLVRKRSLDF